MSSVKRTAAVCAGLVLGIAVVAAEPNDEFDRYLQTLALIGRASTNQLHVRDSSNDDWIVQQPHPWDAVGDRGQYASTETFLSFNSTHPHGGNDGGLWQGKGLNLRQELSLDLDLGPVSIHMRPQVLYSENRDYAIIPSAGGLNEYASYRSTVDIPQRFGDGGIAELVPGASEVRATWRTLTGAIGTMDYWLGPSERDGIMLSTNAAPYPKVEIGLLPTETIVGPVELRLFTGILRESPYFDDDDQNDLRTIAFTTASWAPSFIPGFTFGFHRALLANVVGLSWVQAFGTLFNPVMQPGFGDDQYDQRASLTWEWIAPETGFSFYGEWARNDYSPGYRYITRAPEHTQAYTLGARQVLWHSLDHIVRARFELVHVVNSWDYLIEGGVGGAFYSHGFVRQGHTHLGQVLGASVGSGGVGQSIQFDWYAPFGRLSMFMDRSVRDQDYLYGNPSNYTHNGPAVRGIDRVHTEMAYGVSGAYWIGRFMVTGEVAYLHQQNWNWVAFSDLHGVRLELSVETPIY